MLTHGTLQLVMLKKMKMKRVVKKVVLTALILCVAAVCSYAQHLRANGKLIVDSSGLSVILRGMGLGGWMLQEGYMLQIYNNGTQHSIKKRIADLIGSERCNRFYSSWHSTFVTKADIDSLRCWGFNSVRLPMHYNLFTLPIENEPDSLSNTWLPKGFEMVDSLLSWCKANKMYLILDMHAAPGGQGKDANISDYDDTKPSLWEDNRNRRKLVALWKKLAERYANEEWIAAYDILNEPNWTFEGKNKNGTEDAANTPIWDLYKEITTAIRSVDKNHIVIIEGNGWGNNYNGLPQLWDNNMALSFHKYWNSNSQDQLSGILALRESRNVPIWLGESGENSNKWFTDCIALMESNQIGWAWWPLKKIGSVICPLTINKPNGYDKITSYWNGGTEKPSSEEAAAVFEELSKNLAIGKNGFNKDLIDALFRQVNDTSTIAYDLNLTPCRIPAASYDLGRAGHAYFDTDSERCDNLSLKGGNNGHHLRNDGVDIYFDQKSAQSYVSLKKGEWLKYTVKSPKNKAYKASILLLAAGSTAKLSVVGNGWTISSTITPSDQQIDLGKIMLKKGENSFMVKCTDGEASITAIDLK